RSGAPFRLSPPACLSQWSRPARWVAGHRLSRLRPIEEPARTDATTGRPAAFGRRERSPLLPRRLRARQAHGQQHAFVAERRSPRSRPRSARTNPIDRFWSGRIIASPMATIETERITDFFLRLGSDESLLADYTRDPRQT